MIPQRDLKTLCVNEAGAHVNLEETCESTKWDWELAAECATREHSEQMAYYASKCCKNGRSVCFSDLCMNQNSFLPTALMQYNCVASIPNAVAQENCRSKGCTVFGTSSLCSDATAVTLCKDERPHVAGWVCSRLSALQIVSALQRKSRWHSSILATDKLMYKRLRHTKSNHSINLR